MLEGVFSFWAGVGDRILCPFVRHTSGVATSLDFLLEVCDTTSGFTWTSKLVSHLTLIGSFLTEDTWEFSGFGLRFWRGDMEFTVPPSASNSCLSWVNNFFWKIKWHRLFVYKIKTNKQTKKLKLKECKCKINVPVSLPNSQYAFAHCTSALSVWWTGNKLTIRTVTLSTYSADNIYKIWSKYF